MYTIYIYLFVQLPSGNKHGNGLFTLTPTR